MLDVRTTKAAATDFNMMNAKADDVEVSARRVCRCVSRAESPRDRAAHHRRDAAALQHLSLGLPALPLYPSTSGPTKTLTPHPPPPRVPSRQVFTVRGDGRMSSYSFRVMTGGQTIDFGGLNVLNGGVTIAEHGASITSSGANTDVLTVTSSSTGFTQAALSLIASTTTYTAYNLIEAGTSSDKKFTVRGDGLTTIKSGGLVVTTGGATFTAGGVMVTAGGATVNAGGLKVNAGGLKVREGGATIEDSGDNATVLRVRMREGSARLCAPLRTLRA